MSDNDGMGVEFLILQIAVYILCGILIIIFLPLVGLITYTSYKYAHDHIVKTSKTNLAEKPNLIETGKLVEDKEINMRIEIGEGFKVTEVDECGVTLRNTEMSIVITDHHEPACCEENYVAWVELIDQLAIGTQVEYIQVEEAEECGVRFKFHDQMHPIFVSAYSEGNGHYTSDVSVIIDVFDSSGEVLRSYNIKVEAEYIGMYYGQNRVKNKITKRSKL